MPKTMTEPHKPAIAAGRVQAAKVDTYLQALDMPKPRTRRQSPERRARRLDAILQEMDSARGVRRLLLIQERIDIERAAQAESAAAQDAQPAEEAFVAVAAEFSERKGISYKAWREVGVPAAVLKRARIERS